MEKEDQEGESDDEEGDLERFLKYRNECEGEEEDADDGHRDRERHQGPVSERNLLFPQGHDRLLGLLDQKKDHIFHQRKPPIIRRSIIGLDFIIFMFFCIAW